MIVQEIQKLQTDLHQRHFKSVQIHPATTLESLKQSINCPYCNVMKDVSEDLGNKVEQLCNEYNSLLQLSQKINNCIYDIVDADKTQIEELNREIQMHLSEIEEQKKQFEEALNKKQQQIQQLTALLIKRQQVLEIIQESYLQDQLKENNYQLQNIELKGACDVLTKHRRDHSKLCTTLENQNRQLLIEKNKLIQENVGLKATISEMAEQIQKLEQNLLTNNITTPRVICNGLQLDVDKSDDPKSFEGSGSMIENQSEIREQIEEKYDMDSLQSFFENNKGNALRDIMNISGQTSKYFNLTREKLLKQKMNNDSAQDYSKQGCQLIGKFRSTEEFKRQVGIFATAQDRGIYGQNGKNQEHKNIHEFDIQQNCIDQQKVSITPCKQNKQSTSIMIDPYYAFFTLTIQCIKLNWKNMDEVANIDLSYYWPILLKEGIQMNHWHSQLLKKMKESVKDKNKSKKKGYKFL